MSAESTKLTAIKRQVQFLESIGAVFSISFEGEEFASKTKKRARGENLPWPTTGISEKVSALDIGQEINIKCPEFADMKRVVSYASATAINRFGKGSVICVHASSGESINILRVY